MVLKPAIKVMYGIHTADRRLGPPGHRTLSPQPEAYLTQHHMPWAS